MPSTYTLNNGIELIGTGEQSGTWGDTTNTNLELLDTALDGQVTVTLSSTGSGGSPNTLPISDGSSSNGRNRLVVFNDGSDIGGTVYVQLTPNDAEKIIYVRNSLSGSRSILLFQGTYNASNDYEIPAGTTAIVFFNGGGTGAVAANVFNNAYFDGLRLGSVSVDKILDEDNMASNDAAALATQQSIKAYVDTQVGANNELSEVLANGNTSGGTAIQMTTTDELQFRDTALKISSSADGQLDIDADTEIEIVAPTVDIDASTAMTIDTAAFTVTGAVDFNTSLNVDGTVTADGLTVDGDARLDGGGSGSDTYLRFTEAFSAIQNAGFYLHLDGADDDLYIGRHDTADTNVANDKPVIGIDRSTGDITFYDNSGNASFVYDESAGSTFNEQGADRDFRVESDSNAYALYMDAGASKVGINTSSTSNGILSVYSPTTNGKIFMSDSILGYGYGAFIQGYGVSGSGGYFQLGSVDANTQTVAMQVNQQATAINLLTRDGASGSSASRLYLDQIGGGGAVFNETGQDYDFRVESDSNANMLFVDAGNNHVNIGTSADYNGVLNVFTPGNDIALSLASDNGNASVGPILKLTRLSSSPADGDLAGEINFSANNSAAETFLAKITARQDDVSNATEDSSLIFTIRQAGASATALELTNGDTVFNQDGRDRDFRVESDGNTHMLYVDAGNNHVMVGASTMSNLPSAGGLGISAGGERALSLQSSSADTLMIFRDSGTGSTPPYIGSFGDYLAMSRYGGGAVRLGINETAPQSDLHVSGGGDIRSDVIGGKIGWGSGGGSPWYSYIASSNDGSQNVGLEFFTTTNAGVANINHLHMHPDNGTIFNEGSANLDFRVESDDFSHMLYVDAGSDFVSVGSVNTTLGSGLSVTPTATYGNTVTHRAADTIGGSGQRANMTSGILTIETTSSGNQLTIPVTYSGSFWAQYYVRIVVVSAEYNSSNAKGGEATFTFAEATSINNLVTLSTTGNISSIARVNASNPNPHTLQINFTSAYSSGLNNWEGIQLYYEIVSSWPDRMQMQNAALN